MSEESRNEVYCLLAPLASGRLIVPRASVAEILAYNPPVRPAGAPRWFLGLVDWQGREVPVISFEAACEFDAPQSMDRARIVIFYGLSGALPSGCIGVMTQGFPQLVRVTPDVLSPSTDGAIPKEKPIIAQIRMVNQRPYVPDLPQLEQMAADYLVASGR